MAELKKGTWSVEEDQKLVSYISRYGIWNWSQMPKFAGLSRSGKSCRWMNYLKPNLKKGDFSKEEEEAILHYHSLMGNRWSAIASKLPGRTDNDVKNHWHSHLKKRVDKQNKQNDMCNASPSTSNEIQQPATADDHYHMHDVEHDMIYSSTNHQHMHDVEHDMISSSANSEDHLLELKANNHVTGSPRTLDECFWDQLCPFENLELGNNINHNHMDVFPDHSFQDSNTDMISSYILSNDDYNSSLLFEP